MRTSFEVRTWYLDVAQNLRIQLPLGKPPHLIMRQHSIKIIAIDFSSRSTTYTSLFIKSCTYASPTSCHVSAWLSSTSFALRIACATGAEVNTQIPSPGYTPVFMKPNLPALVRKSDLWLSICKSNMNSYTGSVIVSIPISVGFLRLL
jgi:hypothetical protein